MKRLVLYILGMVLLGIMSVEVSAQCPPNYFPSGMLKQSSAEWYSRYLTAMGDPSLSPAANEEKTETYRFLWLRSFHYPVAIRIWQSSGKRFLIIKQLDGAGGYEPGKLVINRTCVVNQQEWDAFMKLLEQARYWEMASVDDTRRLQDGARWILEGVKQNHYHVVDQQSPEDTSYQEACHYLLKLSGLQIKDSELY